MAVPQSLTPNSLFEIAAFKILSYYSGEIGLFFLSIIGFFSLFNSA